MIPAVSIVIPTYNRRDRLARVLDGVARQTFPLHELEVIVVSDGSTDGSVEWLRSASFPFVLEIVEQPNSGPATARNAGVAKCRGDLVVFIDDDVVPDRGLVAAHHSAHARHGARHVVIGPMLTPDTVRLSPWVRWEQVMLYKQYRDMAAGRWQPTARQFYTGNASVAREALDEVGGFDPTFRRAEDVELAYRLADVGYTFRFEPAAGAHHFAERTFSSWLSIASDYGRNDAVMGRDRGQSWLLDTTRYEFRQSNPLTRVSVRATVGRPRLYEMARTCFRVTSTLATKLRLPFISRYALSGLYNLTYYRSYVDELGDPALLLADTSVNSR